MASRKEEKERLREARLEAETRKTGDDQRRLLLGYLVAGLLAAAVVIGLVIVIANSGGDGSSDTPEAAHIVPQTGFVPADAEPDGREGSAPPAVQQADLEEAAKTANCELALDLPDEGNNHLAPEDPRPDYGTNPPTSGDHDPEPVADGAFTSTLDPANFLHSLEHGRIEIQYDPQLPEQDQLLLKGVFDESPAGMLMFPNPDMPYEVAAAAWTQLLTCDHYDESVLDAIRAFRDTYRGRGPEVVPF